MVWREEAGEEARVRGEGERHGRRGAGEAHPFARQAVERRRLGVAVAVAADVVGAHGVQGDEEDVRRGGGRARLLERSPRAAAGEQEERERDRWEELEGREGTEGSARHGEPLSSRRGA